MANTAERTSPKMAEGEALDLVEAAADCNETILWKMLANRNELKSVGGEEMKLVNTGRLFSRVFLLRRTKKWGSWLVPYVQLYVYGGQDM